MSFADCRRERRTGLVMIVALVLAVAPAFAQVYRCQGPGGQVQYADRPCDGSGTAPMPIRAADASEPLSDPEARGRCEAVQLQVRKLRVELASALARPSGPEPVAGPGGVARKPSAATIRTDIARYQAQSREQGCETPERLAERRECDKLRARFLHYTAGDGRQSTTPTGQHPIHALIAEMKRKACPAQ